MFQTGDNGGSEQAGVWSQTVNVLKAEPPGSANGSMVGRARKKQQGHPKAIV